MTKGAGAYCLRSAIRLYMCVELFKEYNDCVTEIVGHEVNLPSTEVLWLFERKSSMCEHLRRPLESAIVSEY